MLNATRTQRVTLIASLRAHKKHKAMKRKLTRTYHVTSLDAKRLRTMERKIALNTGETKVNTYNNSSSIAANALVSIELTAISQGTGMNNRVANKIRVMRIEMRGFSAPNLDFYFIQGVGTSGPTITNFGGSGGAYMLNNLYNTRFVEWDHKGSNNNQTSAANPIKMVRSFPMGMVTRYDGSAASDGERNRLYLVIVNRDTVTHDVDINARIWYRDN